MVDCLGPQEVGEAALDGVVALGQRGDVEAVAALAGTGVGRRLADLAHKLGEQQDGAGRGVAVRAALRAVPLADKAGLGLADLVGELDDAPFGDAGDLRGPCRRLFDHVIARAHDIGVVGAVLGRALGQGLLVVAHAVGVQEVHVHEVRGDELVRDACYERGVRARHDGNPLHVLVRGQVVAARVDDDYLDVLLLSGHVQVVACTVACHAGVGRGVAEQDHELAFGQGVERAGGPVLSIRIGQCSEGDGGTRVAAVALDLAAAQVEQAEERAVHHHVLLDARAFLDEDGLVAVSLLDARELARDGVEGLFPADALVLALAALGAGHAAHGVVQTVGAVNPAADGAAAETGAGLERAEFRGPRRVAFDGDDLVVFDMALQRACSAAVHMAVGPDDLFVFGGLGRGALLGGALCLGCIGECGRGLCGCQAQAGERRAGHERATRQFRALKRFRHAPSPLFSLVHVDCRRTLAGVR